MGQCDMLKIAAWRGLVPDARGGCFERFLLIARKAVSKRHEVIFRCGFQPLERDADVFRKVVR